jgi:nucleoside-diphosphate-sugar epimerase
MLVEAGHEIIAIDKNAHNLTLLARLNPKTKTLNEDLAIKGNWQKHFANTDIVIQLQAQIAGPNPKPFERNNITSVKNVLEACQKNKIKHLIHLSSSVVISIAKDDYTDTKRTGEELVHASAVPHTILRPPLMYGCFDAKHLGWITRLMQKSPIIPIPGSGKYVRQPLFVQDLCKVILTLTQRTPQNKVYNIIGHEKIPYIAVLRMIAKVKGLKRLFLPLPLPIFSLMLRIYGWLTHKTVFTPDQMQALVAGDEFPVENWSEEFNVPYTPFAQGLKETWNSPCAKYAKEMTSPH